MKMTEWLAQQTLSRMRFDLSIIRPGLNAVNEKMALEMGVSALDLEIGKIPKCHDADKKEFTCPSCEKTIVYLDIKEKHKHCLNCGQALQWH
jgi:hypothetical protein